VPSLIEALTNKSLHTSHQAADALGEIGLDEAAAVPALTDALKDSDGRFRVEAALALYRIEPQPAHLRTLTEFLQAPATRVNAAQALGKLGPSAKQAVPALKAACRDANGGVRSAALDALGKIDPSARPTP